MFLFAKKKQLTWKGDPLFMAANSPSIHIFCLKSTALAPPVFPTPKPPAPTSRIQSIYSYLHTQHLQA